MKRPTTVALAAAAILLAGPTAPAAEAQPAKTKPCDTAEHRQFDFWEGDWEVSQANGKAAGTNRIEKILDGCVLKENWVGAASGLRGESYNIYNGKGWHQTWVDTSGQLLQLDGGLRDGKMVLSGKGTAKDGGKILHQITWTPLEDKRVKQHWQVSRDDGKTWNDAFVGFYARKK